MSEDKPLYAGIEGGGTKSIVAVGKKDGVVLAESRFPTTTARETLGRCADSLIEQQSAIGAIAAIGLATFGPVDLRPTAATYGHVLSTPKPGWTGADLLAPFRKAFSIPTGLDTDVNVAALGEWRRGAAQRLHTSLYFTIGTGIGGGAVPQGQPIHGLLHPEMGHIPLPRAGA